MKTYAKRITGLMVLALAAAGAIAAEAAFFREQAVEEQLCPAEETIVLPGIKGEYRFLFVTDSHVVVMDGSESPKENSYGQDRFNMFLTDGKSAAGRFSGWMDYASRQELDGVLLGGDILDFPSQANLSFLKGRLDGLKCPYLYAPGNHDWTYPWEYMTEKGRREYLPLLAPYMRGNTDLNVLDCGEFLIAAADNSSGQFTETAARGLADVCGRGKPVILLIHVPVLTQSVLTKAREVWKGGVVLGGGNYGGIYPDDASRKVLDLISAKDSPIRAVLAGHVHFADRDMVEGADGVVQLTGDAGFKGAATVIRVTGMGSENII